MFDPPTVLKSIRRASSLFGSVEHSYREEIWDLEGERQKKVWLRVTHFIIHHSGLHHLPSCSSTGCLRGVMLLHELDFWSRFALQHISPSVPLFSTPSFVNKTNIKIHKNQEAERSMYLEIPTWAHVILTMSSKPWGGLVFTSTESV